MKPFKIFMFLMLVASLPVMFSCKQSEPKTTSPIEWAVKMADSDMQRNPDASMLDFSPVPRWSYTQGLVTLANQRLAAQTGDQKYYEYGLAYADKMIDDDGNIDTYSLEKYNVDLVNSGKILFEIYEKTGNEKYKKAMELLNRQLETHPRTSEGGFWHKLIYPHQLWLDGVYMADPFHAQFGVVFGHPEALDDAANQVLVIQKHTHDSITGLNFHGWDESHEQRWADPETGRSAHIWGRALGWYFMAIVDILDFLPQDHPKRNDLIAVLNTVAEAVVKVQEEETGVWYQVLDMGGREGNYRESTASCMFVYALLKGVRMGYLDASYLAPAQKGYEGILNNFIREEEDGTISLTQCCAVAGLGGNPYRDGSYEYYITTQIRDNDPKGVGPFIMASIEMHKAQNK
ncbi:glycoside hydrolase family 88/105 protein [Gaoshiqia sediminis]|uniref:Glycoside hydrolase family 88 protein n=1 Tax=Gaoshiqia sediminis TaxID=2986998 RepID=A0AA42C760_9BACT|nr:glycoside hydrolase family 88 protein [Gaoshiqia sediminis]MCW0481246.1 glycoside hydrolase family 88 protein [Gaoshiqia sediminis]